MSHVSRGRIFFDRPNIYQIRVLGEIDSTWFDRLEGMTISQIPVETGSPIATLEGELIDQAALLGVLNSLHELKHKILSVICLSN
jgi:hypothetical protein